MIRRSLLVVGLLAVMFSVQADPIYYTFSGTVSSNTDASSSFQSGDVITYQFLLDFDMPGLQNNSPLNDYSNYFYGITYSTNYGSAKITSNSDAITYTIEDLTYTAWAAIEQNYYLGESPYYTRSSVYFSDPIAGGGYNEIALNNDSNVPFQLGDVFSFVEKVDPGISGAIKTAMGSVAITRISSTLNDDPVTPPVSSVPEPSTLFMLSGGIIAILGHGLKRKRS
jgi:hypothetical protein